MKNIKVIFWDFDGVLMNSNSIRDLGFQKVLEAFEKNQVERLLDFHKLNGGLSRYVKFRYFFEKIRNENITDDEIYIWSERFSLIMRKLLINQDLLISETVDFVKLNFSKYKMYITSGSDQDELRFICKNLNIEQYFQSIHGSPKPKKDLIYDIIETNLYSRNECVLIGDSINDFEASEYNKIFFKGYNNTVIEQMTNFEIQFS